MNYKHCWFKQWIANNIIVVKRYYIFLKIRIFSCFFGGGEETRPPVGKDINRPKIPIHPPHRRYDKGYTSF